MAENTNPETEALVEAKAEPEVPAEVEKAADEANKKELKKAKKEKKRRYGEIMTTGSFIRTFLLLLIPGINIICIIFWAIGAAKNRNKVNLSRGLICFFLIEVLLVLLIAGIGYIYADQREDKVLNYIDAKTNGLVSYLEIGSYKELPKLLGVSSFLVEKEPAVTPDEPEPEPEPVIPKTCYVYNPEGIDTPEKFAELFKDQFDPEKQAERKEAAKAAEGEEEPDTNTLFGILEAANVDTENSDRIYIILDNDDCNCVIIFNPAGSFEVDSSFPTVSANSDYVLVGGAK
ncbi:MAG: hypothetical protein J5782_01780 [Clostridia bacterium]|nr:hypothetical protein [Clostridia bacterium]